MLRLVSHSPRLNARLEKVKDLIKKRSLDVLIIFRPENLFYLTGFSGTDSALMVFPDKAALLVDLRYEERAELEASNVEIWSGRSVPAILKEALNEAGPDRTGFEASGLTYAEYETIVNNTAGAAKRIELVPVHSPIESLRAIKDQGEIDDLQKAADLADKAIEYLAGRIKPGRTERELSYDAFNFLKKSGADSESFEIIVASGANSSMPHAASTDKKLAKGDLVLVDLGAVVGGYHSDITRTFVIGRPTTDQAAMHRAVLEAGQRVLKEIKPGQGAAQVDDICRSFLDNYGGPARLLHGLGHGVGLTIHEKPQIGTGSTDELKDGMVFTIEPGLYARGYGGVRIEDMVVLNGTPHLMTRSPRELIEL